MELFRIAVGRSLKFDKRQKKIILLTWVDELLEVQEGDQPLDLDAPRRRRQQLQPRDLVVVVVEIVALEMIKMINR